MNDTCAITRFIFRDAPTLQVYRFACGNEFILPADDARLEYAERCPFCGRPLSTAPEVTNVPD
jgi:hypothetical protein